MTLVDVKLSLASVSLCNWILKLGLVLWVFTVVNVRKGHKPFLKKGEKIWFAFLNTNGSFKVQFNTDLVRV